MYESIKELERRINQIRMDILNSNHPSEFEPLLDIPVQNVPVSNRADEYHYVSELLDTRPTLLYKLIDLGEIQISNNDLKQSFLSYIDDVRRMRINNFCSEPKSWKEHTASTFGSLRVYDHGDNYSKHEMM
jgi:hypothetical protein